MFVENLAFIDVPRTTVALRSSHPPRNGSAIHVHVMEQGPPNEESSLQQRVAAVRVITSAVVKSSSGVLDCVFYGFVMRRTHGRSLARSLAAHAHAAPGVPQQPVGRIDGGDPDGGVQRRMRFFS